MNAHPAASSEHWSPGYAKRADTFERVRHAATTWRWQPGQYVTRANAAVLRGTPEISDGQRTLLLYYVEHLNQDRLEQSEAYVWPSIGLTAAVLGCSEREIRRRNKALEDQGYLIRDFNLANRPAGHEAINLAPLLARLDELEAIYDAIRKATKDRRIAYTRSVLTDLSARADNLVPLEQSQSNSRISVTGPDAPTARHWTQGRRDEHADDVSETERDPDHPASPKGPMGSSGGARFEAGGRPEAPEHLERVRQELEAAIQACPELAGYVSAQVRKHPHMATQADAEQIARAAVALLPDPDRNNDQTARWGFRRHGLRIAVMLAVAVKDPKVENPARYFGKLATWDTSRSLDLSFNLKRILAAEDRPPPALPPAVSQEPPARARSIMAAPGADHPTWLAIDGHLRRRVRQGAYGSWFGRVGFHGLENGALTISAPGQTAAAKLRGDYLAVIGQAAADAGHPVDRVIVTVRSADGPGEEASP